MKKLTHQQIVLKQADNAQRPRLPLLAVLDNIRSLHNVGSMFRAADGAGVKKLWLCGITGYPPHPQITKTALDSQEHVSWAYGKDTPVVVEDIKKDGYEIVVLEQTDRSVPYMEFVARGPVCLVVGNEVDGISEAVLPFADHAIDIPMMGIKNSLNVAVAFGIGIFHLASCLQKR